MADCCGCRKDRKFKELDRVDASPFERARKAEAVKMIAAMEGFKQLFGGDNPLKKLIRGVGMRTADAIPGVKQKFITQAMGW